MGQLKDGVYNYDECEGLTEDEINAFYGFEEGGEPFPDEDLESVDELSDEEDPSDGDTDMEDGENPEDVNEQDVEGSDSSNEVCTRYLTWSKN